MNLIFKTRSFISFFILFSLFGVGNSDEGECGPNDGLMWKGTMGDQECIAKQTQEDTPGLVPSGKIEIDGISFYLYCVPEEKKEENPNFMVEQTDEEDDEGYVEDDQLETAQGENEQMKTEQGENEQVKRDQKKNKEAETNKGENEQGNEERGEHEQAEEDSSDKDTQIKKDEL